MSFNRIIFVWIKEKKPICTLISFHKQIMQNQCYSCGQMVTVLAGTWLVRKLIIAPNYFEIWLLTMSPKQCHQIGEFIALLGNFSKPVGTIILPKLTKILAIFVKVSKSLIFLVQSFLGNFFRHLVTFYWSPSSEHNSSFCFILQHFLS